MNPSKKINRSQDPEFYDLFRDKKTAEDTLFVWDKDVERGLRKPESLAIMVEMVVDKLHIKKEDSRYKIIAPYYKRWKNRKLQPWIPPNQGLTNSI